MFYEKYSFIKDKQFNSSDIENSIIPAPFKLDPANGQASKLKN